MQSLFQLKYLDNMDEYTIVEVTEPPVRSPGDGLPRRRPVMARVKKEPQDEIEDDSGPWKEADVVKRLKQTLDSGYLTDLTAIVRNTKFPCHKNILSFASPKLAKMIRKNPHTLQLQMDPNHFRVLLEIIYGGEADKLDNVKDALDVARVAKELQVYTAVVYCTKILGKLLCPASVYEILDFAFLNNDGDLKDSCIKVIQEHTKEVLANKAFLNCNIEILKFVLSQENLQTTELELFLACARWAKKHENPRQALGSALGLIRFKLLTSEEFIKYVKPTQLLTAEEENAFFMYFLSKNGATPEGFSNESKKRNIFQRNDVSRKIGAEEEISIIYDYNSGKFCTTEELNKSPPIRFSINGDVNLIGIKVYSSWFEKSYREKYKEDVIVTLKDEKETIIASAKYCDTVSNRTYYYVRFPSPVPIQSNLVYQLYWKCNVTSGDHLVSIDGQKTFKTKTKLELKILNETWSPIEAFIIAPNV